MFSGFVAPTDPAEITVFKSESANTIYLEWNPLPAEKLNGRLVGYALAYLKVDDIQDYKNKLTTVLYNRTSPRNYTFVGLQPDTKYFVGVAAYNSLGHTFPDDKSHWSRYAKQVFTLEGSKQNEYRKFRCIKSREFDLKFLKHNLGVG